MEKRSDLLSFGALAVISAALFSGHFGVGDVIFPPILGKGAGADWFTAAMGYGIINSLGSWPISPWRGSRRPSSR